MCKHLNLSHIESIEHLESSFYHKDKLYITSDTGCSIRSSVHCLDCRKSWPITSNSPKFIEIFHEKVMEDKQNHNPFKNERRC